MSLAFAHRSNKPRGASNSRRAASARQSAWRARQRVGQEVVPAVIDAAVLDMLVRLNWLPEYLTSTVAP